MGDSRGRERERYRGREGERDRRLVEGGSLSWSCWLAPLASPSQFHSESTFRSGISSVVCMFVMVIASKRKWLLVSLQS